MKNYILLVILIAGSIFTANAQSKKNQNKETYLNELVTIMQGHYSSEKQSVADTSYFNISLRMVPIWKSKGHYLFVEQALFKKQDKPYRVRIYKLVQDGDKFISQIYTLKNEKEWIGKGNTPEAFDALTENDIELKQGCEVVLKRIDKNKFLGQTGEKTCPSELRGASYATSKVTVLENQILSWDQGFDKEGKQVWGAEKAGYVFDKL
ncbi:chromophore lyase CpcT/CpeT [Flavobacterium terrisoli]|uniref:chromophore lyase CpcT/CpeT n=1 Tax=Flavobacterium terrisoli TaxID=3242195 RepID=UPI0025434CE8|nr:chromophore lyase CpcT/CpeT [Flavobacterium buctense]